ncbi:hypothetical protein C0Q70_14756 [Pomacea canaliculata]|uniref:VWFA domain-containing protein n=1 Tax=Pomacea canaliculata TaxID=400727 RepID=A0A2T7NSY9_POMCA|nr:hypothetical protein C0Q70_14756 [Pomacea canaliculata]
MATRIGCGRNPGVMLWMIMMTLTQVNLCQAKAMLEDHGYKGITVVINRDVPEDKVLLTKLEESLTEASKVLLQTTRGQVYFEEFIIVLPETWTKNPQYGIANNTGDSTEQILISSTKSEYGDAPYVKQPRGCGQPGLFMHLTPSYITDDSISAKWGPRGKGVIKTKVFPRNSSSILSIMFTHYAEKVEFCDKSTKEGNVLHNVLASNRQNIHCNKKSAWEVMKEHSDFKEERHPLPFEETRPIQFKYVQVLPRRRVFVLDISGSMTVDHRLTRMRSSVSDMILNMLEVNSTVGIVEFNNLASVRSQCVTIVTKADRKSLITKLPTDAGGGTSIGAGLRLGLEVLHKGMNTPAGGTLVVVSDGEENTAPYVRDILPEIQSKSVVVDTISLTKEASSVMSLMSSSTGGQSFFDSANYNSTALIDSLAAIVTSGGLTHDPRVPLLLHTEAGTVSINSPLTGEFYVDNTLGEDTTVSVSFTSTVNVSLTGPGNLTISRDTHPGLYITEVDNMIMIQLSEVIKNGTWSYRITATQVDSHVVVTVQSRASKDGSDVIQVLSWLPEEHNLDFAPDQKLAIYAEVTRGRSSVLNSQVVAIIERPQSGPLRIDLRDNGVGSDITEDDGIYSAYILAKDLSGDGRYGIKVKVEGVDGLTSVVVGGRGGSSGALEVDTDGIIEELVTEELGRFERVRSAGLFAVSGFPSDMTSIPDAIPPSRITDLTVSNDDTKDGAAELEWTSVGGDMDIGTAAKYTFYFITDLDLVDSAGFNDSMWSEVNQTYLRDLRSPQPAGSRERVNISLDLLGDNDTLVLCVRATDDVGNAGELSNIVSVTRVRDPDVVTKVEDAESNTKFYILVTVPLVLAVALLAALITGLVLVGWRSGKLK